MTEDKIWGVFCEYKLLGDAWVTAVLYGDTCYIEPRYNDTQLQSQFYIFFIEMLQIVLFWNATTCPIYINYCGCWWPGGIRSQGICKHDIT